MIRIDAYRFGHMSIDGKTYTKDLIICGDRVLPGWRRKSGHVLAEEDLREVLTGPPLFLIIGTGAAGMMKVDRDFQERLKASGIDILVRRTPEAVKAYNQRDPRQKTVFASHLTC